MIDYSDDSPQVRKLNKKMFDMQFDLDERLAHRPWTLTEDEVRRIYGDLLALELELALLRDEDIPFNKASTQGDTNEVKCYT